MDFPSGFIPFFIQIITGISGFHDHAHPFWFSPSTQAAIGPQTHLAHPPSIPWPCATTPTPLQLTLSRFFAVSPVKTGTHSKIFQFSTLGALGMHPYHLLHLPTLPGLWPHLHTRPRLSHTCAHLVYLLCTIAHLFAHIRTPSCTLLPLSMPICTPLHSLCAPTMHLPCTHAHFVLHLPGLSPLSNFLFNLRPPSGYHGQPSPSATGHSAHFRTPV